MKRLMNFTLYYLATVSLTVGLIICFTSTFLVNYDLLSVIVCGAVSALLFAIPSELVPKTRHFILAPVFGGMVLAAVVYFRFTEILSELTYAVNCALKYYAAAYPLPASVSLTEKTADSASLFLSLLAILLSAVIAVSLCRAKNFIPVLIVSLLVMAPCFVVVDVLPSVPALLFTISLLMALFVTNTIRKKNYKISSAALIGALAVILTATIVIANIFPLQNYQRFEWQDNLLSHAEELTGIKSTHGAGELAVKSSDEADDIDLTKIGRNPPTHKHELDVLAEHNGVIYLRGVSYANFEDNKWSVLTDEQAEQFPQNQNTFILPNTYEAEERVSVKTVNADQTAYVPYFITALPEGFTSMNDVLVRNDSGTLSYDYDCYRHDYSADGVFERSTPYTNFIFSQYTSLDDETRNALFQLILEDDELSAAYASDDVAQMLQAIKGYVSSKGYYSLDAETMPSGESFPVWFLTEAESGYCVHYATAAAALLRAAGIPSRYVTGYYAAVKDGEWTTVTSNNAHAWAEYYDTNLGWVPLEATPPDFSPSVYTPESHTEEPKPTSMQPTTSPARQNRTNDNQSSERLSKTAVTLITVSAVVLALLLTEIIRIMIVKSRRTKRPGGGRLNDRAVSAYRYIERLSRYTKHEIPEELEEIALTARFSRSSVDRRQLDKMIKYSDKEISELKSNSSLVKKLFYQWIIVLY